MIPNENRSGEVRKFVSYIVPPYDFGVLFGFMPVFQTKNELQ
jgi:hypothetical protein